MKLIKLKREFSEVVRFKINKMKGSSFFTYCNTWKIKFKKLLLTIRK